jgi:predicted GTPase
LAQFINEVTNSELTVGDELVSCTKDVAFSNSITVQKRNVKLVDLPGFDNDDDSLPDEVILQKAKHFLERWII